MNRWGWFLVTGLVAFLLQVGGVLGAQPTSDLKKGIQWFTKRARPVPKPTVNQGALDRSIEFFERAFRTASDSMVRRRAAGKLLLARYLEARFGHLPDSERLDRYTRGKKRGRELIRQYSESVPILYATVAHLGRWAEHTGIMGAAREGTAGELRTLARKMIRLQPEFNGGAGHRLLARVHHKAPYIPLILSWPSEEKARQQIEKALEIAPDNPMNNLVLGNMLFANGSEQEARTYWRKASRQDPRANYPLLDRDAIHRAEQQLEP